MIYCHICVRRASQSCMANVLLWVSGFSLHGGVHFGGLSELYGLASDNILSLKAVIANGSMVELTNSSCYMNAKGIDYHECNGLWFSLRGAGSSFAVLTELTIQLHRLPSTFNSSLSIFEVMVSSSTNASRYIDTFINSVPSEVSLPSLVLMLTSKHFYS